VDRITKQEDRAN
jgi:hypothetical protein